MQQSDASHISDLEADNRRLRRLLDQRDAPAELRHRLNGTLSLLRSIIRRSAEGRTSVTAYAAHLEDRLATLMRTQDYIDTHGEVEFSTLVADEFAAYGAHEERQLRLDGPPVRFKPRAGQTLGLAVHELAVNAVEHGVLPTGAGRVDVTWRVDVAWRGDQHPPVPAFLLDWKETGACGLAEPSRRRFGTEVLTSMIRHELGAETTFAPEPDGIRWAIRFPLPPKIGRVAIPEAP